MTADCVGELMDLVLTGIRLIRVLSRAAPLVLLFLIIVATRLAGARRSILLRVRMRLKCMANLQVSMLIFLVLIDGCFWALGLVGIVGLFWRRRLLLRL